MRAKKCEGKTRYPAEHFAWQGIERLRQRTGTTDTFTPYRCGFCGGWHFGHPPAKVRAQLLKKAA